MDRLQLHHTMAERANDTPTTSCRSRRHCHGAKRDHPFGEYERWRVQKIEPARQIIEATGLCSSKQRQCDNTHCFLCIICAVAMGHPSRAEDLQFPKERLNKL